MDTTLKQTTQVRSSEIAYLATLDLADALWWFIENVNDDTPNRSSMFFALRERVRAKTGPVAASIV